MFKRLPRACSVSNGSKPKRVRSCAARCSLAGLAIQTTNRNVTATTPPATVPTQPSAETPAASTPARAVRPSRRAAVLAVQAHALAHANFDAAAAAVVNQLAKTLPCERVSLGLYIGGRLRIGLLRGTPNEYITYGTNPWESRERCEEGALLIKRAFSEPEPFGWEGRYYRYRSVSVWPRPAQPGGPRILISGNSPDGAVFAGKHGFDV